MTVRPASDAVFTRNGVRLGNRRFGIGEIAVMAVFTMLVASWALIRYFPAAEIARDIFLAGFVGGFTNTVAIRMLFTHYWYLPGSGVLLKEKDAIVLSLADTMEEHILNPDLIAGKVHELEANFEPAGAASVANAVLDEIRPDLVAYANAPAQRERLVAALREEGGFWGGMANSLGLMTYDEVADRFAAGLSTQVAAFEITEDMVESALAHIGSLDDFVLKPGNPLLVKHYGTELSLAQLVFEKLDAKQLVVDKLSAYDAGEIRDIIARNIREHLAWLEVFGVILGMAFATVAAIVDALL
ncbi:MAG: DUF445 family protein [Anaerolineae bacterium]|jgi:uncharacterized membrane protein YheB (UPF0754 family)